MIEENYEYWLCKAPQIGINVLLITSHHGRRKLWILTL